MKNRLNMWIITTASIVLLPFAVFAGEGKAPLPQLDVNQYPGLLFWLAISFPSLFLLMRFVALPRIWQTQSSRQEILRNDLQAAEADNEQARLLRESYEKSLIDARTEAQATIASILAAASQEEMELRVAQQKELNSRIAEAEKKITEFRNSAIKEGRKAATVLAESIVENLTGAKTGRVMQ